jgi:hypothetical protein
MTDINKKREHLLQKYEVLPEFEIISVTSLEDFMDTYSKVANSSDDITKISEVSGLLKKKQDEIPGFVFKGGESISNVKNPELDKVVYALIEFIMKKTTEPSEWAYILTNTINKMGLELNDSDEEAGDGDI